MKHDYDQHLKHTPVKIALVVGLGLTALIWGYVNGPSVNNQKQILGIMIINSLN